MKMATIKKYLRQQRIRSRRSTWSNAFASALSLHDDYDETVVADAVRDLGQDPEGELSCAYCGEPAATWDHVFNTVERGEFSGYGHRIRNLIPSCRTCNERKGGKLWRDWLEKLVPPDIEKRVSRIERFLHHADAQKITTDDFKRVAPDEFNRFIEIRDQVFKMLDEADDLAENIREKMRADYLDAAS